MMCGLWGRVVLFTLARVHMCILQHFRLSRSARPHLLLLAARRLLVVRDARRAPRGDLDLGERESARARGASASARERARRTDSA